MPRVSSTLPEHPLIECEAPATRLNMSWEVGVSQPKPFVYTSPAEIWLLLTRRGRWIFKQLWSDLDPNCPLVGTWDLHYFYCGDPKPC